MMPWSSTSSESSDVASDLATEESPNDFFGARGA